jgi:hypothetical protein
MGEKKGAYWVLVGKPEGKEPLKRLGVNGRMHLQWNLELRTQSVPGDGSTFKLFDFRVKFPHKKYCKLN